MGRGPSLHSFLNAVARDVARAPIRAEAERKRQIRNQQRAMRQAERDRIYEEKERRRQYIEDRIQEAFDINIDLVEQIKELESILPRALATRNTISFEALKPKDTPPKFCPPDEIAHPLQPPQKEDFLASVKKPNWLTGMFSKVKKAYDQNLQEAEKNYAIALESHGHAETKRKSDLQVLEKQHDEEMGQFLAKMKSKNKEIEAFEKAYLEANEEAIVDYYTLLFDNSEYPENFPQQFRIAYRSDSKQLAIEYEFPAVDVIPIMQEYRYIKSRDAIEEKPRKVSEIRALYQNIVSSVALKTLHEVFDADEADHIDVAVFNGYVKSIDLATGKNVQPFLISVRTVRETFLEVDLTKVDKIVCLRNLGAQMSPRPSEMLAVKPVIEFDMIDRRFVDQKDILSEIDSRPNLMELNPFEFENLVSNLFDKMGLESRLTRSSRDGGVDAIAFDKRPVIGGKIVIQAKRYSNTVGVSAVRDLYGTMMNEGANKGILVCTSSYGPDAYGFAKDKPIELIDGGGLLYLLDQVGIPARIYFVKDN